MDVENYIYTKLSFSYWYRIHPYLSSKRVTNCCFKVKICPHSFGCLETMRFLSVPYVYAAILELERNDCEEWDFFKLVE